MAKKREKFIPAEEVLPELKEPVKRVSAVLRGARYRNNMTQKDLAGKIGIPVRCISEMENGKRFIGQEMAEKLSVILKSSHKVFL